MSVIIQGKKWPEDFPNRFFMGMHTADTDQNGTIPGLLSRMDGREIIRRLADVGVNAVYFYSSCHCGNCFYPTRIPLAHTHSGLNGRDVFGEAADECQRRGIAFIAVYEFMNMRIKEFGPREWRHYYPEPGVNNGSTGGYSGLCWNTGYGEFVLKQLEEVAQRYPIAGYYVDMLDHPGLVCCEGCARRFKEAVGVAPPRKIDTESSLYKAFKLWTYRDEARYLNEIRDRLNACRPGVTVVNNTHLIRCEDLYETSGANDYLTTDPGMAYGSAYGAARHGALMSTFRSLSRGKHAFEILSDPIFDCRSVISPEPYNAVNATVRAHGGVAGYPSMLLEREGNVSEACLALAKEANAFVNERLPWNAGGEAIRFAGVYLSQESEIFHANPDWRTKNDAYYEAFLGACHALQEEHLPTDTLTRRDLGRLDEYPVVYLPNVVCASDAEIAAFTAYVENGGVLIGSYDTSLRNEWNEKRANFGLAEIFGVNYLGKTVEPFVALQMPLPRGLFDTEPWENRDISLLAAGLVCETRPGAETLVRLHDRYRVDPEKNSSALFNAYTKVEPLGPGVVVNRRGKGKAIYFAGNIFTAYLRSGVLSLRKLVARWLINDVINAKCIVRMDAPPSIEMVAWAQPEKSRLLVHLVNYQSAPGRAHMPNDIAPLVESVMPALDLKLWVKLKRKDIKTAILRPSGEALKIKSDQESGSVVITIPKARAHDIVELVLRDGACPVYPNSDKRFDYPKMDLRAKVAEWLATSPENYNPDDDGSMDFSKWRPAEDFLTDWNFVGPFPHGAAKTDTPESNPALDAVYAGLAGETRWMEVSGVDRYPGGLVEMANFIGNTPGAVGYAMCFLRSDAARRATLWLGNDDDCAIFLNGVEIFSEPGSETRDLKPDRKQIPMELREGVNTLLIRKRHIGHGYHFYARIDAPDGELVCSASPNDPGRRVQKTTQKTNNWNGRGVGQV